MKTVYLIISLNNKTRLWLENNLATESWQWSGQSLAVEHRYIALIIEGLNKLGLKINRDYRVE